ncbi:MAG: hypothetical protein R3B96_06270 [Pirellulaceae bacterium]
MRTSRDADSSPQQRTRQWIMPFAAGSSLNYSDTDVRLHATFANRQLETGTSDAARGLVFALTSNQSEVGQDVGHVHGNALGDAVQFSPFFHRVDVAPQDAGLPSNIERLPAVPGNFHPWWTLSIREQISRSSPPSRSTSNS